MTRLGLALKLTTALAVMGCVIAVTAASALATVSVEPLNTAFNGKSAESPEYILENKNEALISGSCKEATLSGTTNSTKTNYFNGTDAFVSCPFSFGGTIVFSNSCPKEGTIPWTVTFAEGKTTSVKLNCALVAKRGACVVTAHEQTVSGPGWSNVTSGLELTKGIRLAITSNEACTETFGVWNFLTLKYSLTIKGIKVTT